MSKDIKKALEHCINNECVDCPNNEELGSGDIVCRARLLPEVLEYISDLQHRLDVAEKALELCERYHIGFKDATLEEQVVWRETRVKENINYFKEKAEKELKGE